MKTKKIFLTVLFIFVGLGLVFSIKDYIDYVQQFKYKQLARQRQQRAWVRLKDVLENKVRHFNGTVSLVFRDLDSGREIDFNQDTLLPSASLVKVPILLAYFYAEQDKKISLKDTLTLKLSQKVAGSKVLGAQPVGATFTVQELLDPMITHSDNAAANVLIDYLGFDTLNAYFKKIGLKNTNIARNMMDFAERSEGEENYTTAEDMAYLLDKLYHQAFLSKSISESCLDLLGQQKINDRIPLRLPKNEIFIAHKTGLEKTVCHDIGIIYTQKGDFILCVLVKHHNRFARDAKKLISDIALLTFNYYQNL